MHGGAADQGGGAAHGEAALDHLHVVLRRLLSESARTADATARITEMIERTQGQTPPS